MKAAVHNVGVSLAVLGFAGFFMLGGPASLLVILGLVLLFVVLFLAGVAFIALAARLPEPSRSVASRAVKA